MATMNTKNPPAQATITCGCMPVAKAKLCIPLDTASNPKDSNDDASSSALSNEKSRIRVRSCHRQQHFAMFEFY